MLEGGMAGSAQSTNSGRGPHMKPILSALLFMLTSFAALAQNVSTPREQLKQMITQLQSNPGDDALREKIIKLAQEVQNNGTVQLGSYAASAGCRDDVFGEFPDRSKVVLDYIHWELRPKDGPPCEIYSNTQLLWNSGFIYISCDRQSLRGSRDDYSFHYIVFARTDNPTP
jgi:hypothetical protein